MVDAEKLVDALMINSFGDVALRLQLRGFGERDLGGMNRACVKRIITRVIEEETQALRAQVTELREEVGRTINRLWNIDGSKAPYSEIVEITKTLRAALSRVEAGTGKADRWISVKDRLPDVTDDTTDGLAYLGFEKYPQIMWYWKHSGWNDDEGPANPTYWMPLPIDPPAMGTL